MNTSKIRFKCFEGMVLLGGIAMLLTGCPEYLPPVDGSSDYDLGFDDGFAVDEEYWYGYDDSMATVDGGDIYYDGSNIPIIEDDSYEAGYWDGVWYAYNDGYFVAYDYAFTIGFGEGYDAAFTPAWLVFLAGDAHVEWLDGGFTDGYNDGFSEGRIFGAYDYVNALPFDWLDAMEDYRFGSGGAGTDLCMEGYCTGLDGPVYLYEYGTDPFDLIAKKTTAPRRGNRPVPSIRGRNSLEKAEVPDLSYRPLLETYRDALNLTPVTSARATAPLRLTTSWLQRVEAYLGTLESGAKSVKNPRAGCTRRQ